MAAIRTSGGGRSLRLRVAGALLVAGIVHACTGDNLFTGVASVGVLGPEVEITAPQDNFAMTLADSVLVTAIVSSPNSGVSSVKYSGIAAGGGAAMTEIVVPLPNPPDSTVSRYMKPTGTTGAVKIIVEATDILGERGADTVDVTIN